MARPLGGRGTDKSQSEEHERNFKAMFTPPKSIRKAAHDKAFAKKLVEVCPVDIFAADAKGHATIVEENLDECILCEMCASGRPLEGRPRASYTAARRWNASARAVTAAGVCAVILTLPCPKTFATRSEGFMAFAHTVEGEAAARSLPALPGVLRPGASPVPTPC